MNIISKHITIILLFLSFSIPTQAVVAIHTPIQKTEAKPQAEKSKKERRKARRKITWKKTLKHGLLPLLQGISLAIVLSIGLTGSALVGLLFFNAAMLLAYITMRRKKKRMLKTSVVISCLTIVINLVAAAIAYANANAS